jgi:Ras family protein
MEDLNAGVTPADAAGGSPVAATSRSPPGRTAAASDLNDDVFIEAATSRYYLEEEDNDESCWIPFIGYLCQKPNNTDVNDALLRTPTFSTGLTDSPVAHCCGFSVKSRKRPNTFERHTLPRLSSTILPTSRQTPNSTGRVSSPTTPRQRTTSVPLDNGSVAGTPPQLRQRLLEPRNTQVEVVRKIVMLGARNSGKSSVVHRFAQKRFGSSYDPTIESTIRTKTVVKDVTFLCDVIDTAGQDEYSTFSRQATVGVHGYCMVFSVTSLQSFQAIQKIYERITDLVGSYTVPIVLVGTKSDDETHREVPTAAGLSLAGSWGAAYVECSAKSDFGIREVFTTLLQEIERDSGLLASTDSDDSAEPSTGKSCVIS